MVAIHYIDFKIMKNSDVLEKDMEVINAMKSHSKQSSCSVMQVLF